MIDIKEGINHFNNSEFFEAHDYFEDKWNNCESKDRLFFQGMVQIAVANYHLVCGNYKGSQNQYRKATEKLENYLPNYYNINLAKLLTDSDIVKRSLANYFVDNKNEINLNQIPEIETIK